MRAPNQSTLESVQVHMAVTFCLIALIAVAVTPSTALSTVASYRVRMAPGSLVLSVDATVPIAGSDFRMDSTRPADIPELDSLGWAGLLSRLTVSDATGRKLEVVRTGKSRWKLAQPLTGTIRLEYDVDYSLLGKRGWPAPREAAYADSSALVLVGRSLFLTTPAVRASE